MPANKTSWYHLTAIFTSIVWGTTFVSTKVLIMKGLSPNEIFFLRFLLAYIGIWFFSPRIFMAQSIKDELLLAGAGLTGGSLYFILENTALKITLASNVSLIICTAPILTAFLSSLVYKQERIRKHLVYGSVVALAGVALVVFNGSFILQINPLGDILTVLAALSWAFYGVIVKHLDRRYSILFITRKVFFYGLITTIPFFFFSPLNPDVSVLLDPVVISNLIFLGLIASLLCFILWNTAVKQLGVIKTSNYIYLIPLVTLLTSVIVIDEKITYIALLGSALILCGVYVAEKGFRIRKKSGNCKLPVI